MAPPKPITIQTAAPSPGLPAGAVAEAYYIVKDNRVILTSRNGLALHDPEGRDYTRELGKGDDERQIAAQLLRGFRTKVRGARTSGFDGPIRYPKGKAGW